MPRIAIAAISMLGVLALALGVSLAVVVARDDEDSDHEHPSGSGYAGMMGAMATMDSEAMLARMREVLGEEGYALMLEHMQDHRAGAVGPAGSGVDGMMHEMMDGMMSIMPADGGGHMFPNDSMPGSMQP